MRKNILNSLVLIGIVLLAFGCKPKKIIVAPPVAAPDKVEVLSDSKQENLNMLQSKDLLFNTLSLKGKANLTINGNENNVTMLIKIQKDEKIWVSVTAPIVGEVARALITPDSLLLRNNLKREYARKPFSYIYGFTNKQVNFKMLQAVFSGNTIADFMTVTSDLKQENGVWVLSGSKNNLAYQSLFNTLLKVNETSLNDVKTAQAFKVAYGDYTPLNEALFPSSLKINSMAGKKKIDIDVNFTKIDVNIPLEFPFTVPKSYELIK
ncbi:DUF4292 domain-containing protein [Pedobacter insulae]|uniref:DUF4292 domain-containing protein n=1 Tax=Pedobacter insulae TaxID=414048 RepID=A0A1I2YXM5_9SPHI|nr:DUF4292 domain-containing protein [Pedobacter insulae]SFH30397.1 protein of unknown function [Pedobacter insulae]